MNIKEFILERNIDSIQYTEGLILNLISNGISYGLDINTSSVESGTVLLDSTDFIIENNSLIFGDIVLNLEETYLL